MKRFLPVIFVLLCIMVMLTVSVSATDRVVFIAGGATGDGSSADSPINSILSAYELVGDNNATFVICGSVKMSARLAGAAHTGKVTYTSVYDGADYRESGAMINIASYTLSFNGETELNNINISAVTGVIAGNFKGLTLGDGITTSGKIYVCGGNNNESITAFSGNSYLTINSGTYFDICAFGRSTLNVSHTGTMTTVIGGSTKITGGINLGVANANNSVGGNSILTLKDAVKPTASVFLCGNGGLNGYVTVNVLDTATITSFGNVALSTGTRTLNYESTATLPTGYADVFDSVNQIDSSEGEKDISIDGIYAENVISIEVNGEAYNCEVSPIENGICFAAPDELTDFSLAITLKNSAYTINEYTVANGVATFVRSNNYDGSVIYVAGGHNGNGLTPNTAVGSLADAYDLLLTETATIVIVDELNLSASFTPADRTGIITITSVYGGVDYREKGAILGFPVSSRFTLSCETVFKDLTIDVTTTGVIAAAFHPVTFDTGIVVNETQSTTDTNGLYVVGGHNNIADNAVINSDTHITLKSGTFSRVVGFSRYCGSRVHTGTAYINISGTAKVNYLFCGAVASTATSKDSVVTISDDSLVETFYTGGSAAANTTTGAVTININGGDIYEFDVISLDTSLGKVTLIYDPRYVADGVKELADLARFTVKTTCTDKGSHTFGEAFANPFDTELSAHTCAVCGYTELLSQVPARVAENVVFVADGGFGDGSSPSMPFGSYEDAFNALGDIGGTIVVIRACTIHTNFMFKQGVNQLSFVEPNHSGEVLVTSLYNGVDYRENGAKLIFDGDMHYRLYGPVTFDNIVFDTTSTTTNLIAARYNKLIFGDNCEMLKTADDGYRLFVVGGYQYFTYADFIGVEIEDDLIEMTTPARPIPYEEVLTDLAPISINTNYSLRTDAAAAFNKMYEDMAAAGLKMPTITDGFRTYRRQYALYTNSLGNARVDGKDYYDAHLTVARSCSVPGGSEHQLGFAVDMFDTTLDYDPGIVHHYYDQTEEWAWVMENGKNYGIVLRFLSTKTRETGFIKENWHFRYIGVEHAIAISETDYCLEEYVGEIMGMFDLNSSVTVKSGSFYQIMGGSRGCEAITLTGTNRVTVDDDVVYTELVDVDECVLENAAVVLNGKEYLSIKDALEKAENGDTITLIADVSGDGVVIDQDVVIDLGGFTYTVDGELVGSNGTQTQALWLLKDNDITIKNGTITSANALLLVQNNSNLTLDGVKLDGTNLTGEASYTLLCDGGTTVIKNSDILAVSSGMALEINAFGEYNTSVAVQNSNIIGRVKISDINGDNATAELIDDNSAEYTTSGYYIQNGQSFTVLVPPYGDVDSDGDIDISDAILLLRNVLNGTSSAGLIDVLRILKHVAGLIDLTKF